MKVGTLIVARVVALLAVTNIATATAHSESRHKPRVIATTDGEIDDECSMVRLLIQISGLTAMMSWFGISA